jgi:hypothetical protein
MVNLRIGSITGHLFYPPAFATLGFCNNGVKTAVDFIAPKEREKVERNMSSGLEHSYTTSGLKKDGTTFPVEIQGRMLS